MERGFKLSASAQASSSYTNYPGLGNSEDRGQAQ